MNQKILNISVSNISLTELLNEFNGGIVVTPNVDHLVMLQKNASFLNAYNNANYRLVDGTVVFWALKFLGRGVREKISGSDLLPAFVAHHAKQVDGNRKAKVFLLGGKDGVAQQAMINLNNKFPGSVVVDALSPSMKFVDDEVECALAIEIINSSMADTLVVCLGAPKQEIWIADHQHRFLHIKRFMALGAAIDFEAGTIQRAPTWISNVGLEWAYRLCLEPKRLFKRYLVRDPIFFWYLIKDKFGF